MYCLSTKNIIGAKRQCTSKPLFKLLHKAFFDSLRDDGQAKQIQKSFSCSNIADTISKQITFYGSKTQTHFFRLDQE